ncbi:hypothetical protein CF319_g4164 [Tilletia indica]|uniref:Hydrophobin n=2 Tax=Tilletia TaxID=13289 RepID=A0A8X7T4S7_9BASI|nr:hypothetical protein CF327_g2782 [Tilletia walkeri]KAE8222672.1 hypothetical protein CF319_g4164 [Tilletia indica]KAE8231321.1 hypothetical protein CF326_g3666 [Tilletia indica]KAE8257473.1 hypothetical protein A4X13_0g2332 [Tilletia indica]KAE8268872.1 hypothetical protein A4X09_0g3453 [Tilletia walkeri]
MNIRNIILSSIFLAASASATFADPFCINLCCARVVNSRTGLVGRECLPVLPGPAGLICPRRTVCCKYTAPFGTAGSVCRPGFF